MNTDLSMQVMAMNSAQVQNSTQIAVFKKNHELQSQLLVDMLQSAMPPAPAGQGLQVNKQA
ncbi:MAG: hypothetical protein P0Y65_20295 [Candidatus Devosia phytovorans]|uniref:Motility protein n=1 Tax=Candidatus Devosia phytovorans TaxID=3121372 RepID=A0AAJ5VV52_9HYPH|nr:hypothetical protein [Devosia sp.]WEK04485.1 MAG: hypothetical protein P0Y65_20295 [Devosia sp.]